MNLAKGAINLSRNPQFWLYLTAHCGYPINDEHSARSMLLTCCGVRRPIEFREKPKAARRYLNLVELFTKHAWYTHG